MHGTTTDAIPLISDVSGPSEGFAGPATSVGWAITFAVHNALIRGIGLNH